VSRLFITPREIDFIADLNKEIVKDVIGQKIYFYKARQDLSDIHAVYEESINKVFDPPIEIDARIDWDPSEVRTNRFGQENYYSISVYLQSRDLLDRDIDVEPGDYFSYGDVFFEVTSTVVVSNIYGEVEHSTGIKVTGKQARIGQILRDPIGPTDESYSDKGAIQETFVQQRGFDENALGKTDDVRSLQKKDVLEKPLTGPKEVSPKGGTGKEDEIGMIDSSFYGDN
tara:strand:+ start:502 stop:1185 length:684 start_codon:yes stop_codon:yes gene_type:complete